MPRLLSTIPYDSLVGLDDPKLAMMCLAVDPKLKGLIIRGPSGVGKTALIRALSEILFEGIAVGVPMNTTDEHMFGSLDIEAAIATGEVKFSKGLMSEADGGTLVIDDINLFDRKFVHNLMGSVTENKIRVEREGLSFEYEADVSIIATINSREPELNTSISDLFDMRVSINEPDDEGFKKQVMKANFFDQEETDFDASEIKAKVARARELLPDVEIPEESVDTIIDIAVRYGCDGHRGEISAVRVAKAMAALDGRKTVSDADVVKACMFCLDHRRSRRKELKNDGHKEYVDMFMQNSLTRILKRTAEVAEQQKAAEAEASEEGECPQSGVVSMDSIGGVVDGDSDLMVKAEIGEMFDSIDIVEDSRKQLNVMDVKQERKSIAAKGQEGRYVSSRPKSEGNNDIAIDATIRKAAPYQKARRGDDNTLVIKDYDLMEKVREKHVSCLFMFMIDTSGSLVISRRMTAVKAAVLSMITDHFLRHDSVAIGVFNEAEIGMVQTPTHSTSSIKSVLSEIVIGRKTPLSEAILYSEDYVKSYLRKHPHDMCYVIMMTDALANIPLAEGNNPVEEAMDIASKVSHDRLNWIVVNTASKNADRTVGERFAKSLGAPYYLLDDLKSSNPAGEYWAMTKVEGAHYGRRI